MARYRCSNCKKIIVRDARAKHRRGKKRLRLFCTKTGKDSIITKEK